MNIKDTLYLEQIDAYYNKKLKSNVIITVLDTPKYLQELGLNDVPIVMKQRTLQKCIRKAHGSISAHGLDRKMMETLPEQIRNPILAIEERERNSFALISDYKDKDGNNMLVALEMNVTHNNINVNEVKSFYGRNNLEVYIKKHDPSEVHVVDNKKARQLASLLRLQLPTPSQVSDYIETLPQAERKVNKKNDKNSVVQSLQKYQKQISSDPQANNLEDLNKSVDPIKPIIICNNFMNIEKSSELQWQKRCIKSGNV